MSGREQHVKIQGDGNAVGNNNRITVIKQDNRRYGGKGGGGGNGGENDDASVFIGAAVALTFATAVGAYYFARHANAVYTGLRVMTGVEALIALIVAVMFVRREGYAVGAKAGVMAFVSLLASMVLYIAHNSYPAEVISLAQDSGGARAFWCGLNVYGRQLSLLHAVTATFGIGVASLFLLPSTAILGFFAFFSVEVTERTYDKLEMWTSWGPVVMAIPLVLAVVYAHSPEGWDWWASFGDPLSVLFCGNRR